MVPMPQCPVPCHQTHETPRNQVPAHGSFSGDASEMSAIVAKAQRPRRTLSARGFPDDMGGSRRSAPEDAGSEGGVPSLGRSQSSISSLMPGKVGLQVHRLSPKTSRMDKVAYFLDRILAQRSGFFAILALSGLLQVFVFGFIYSYFWIYEGADGESGECGDPRLEGRINRFTEGVWEAWTFMADPGTHSKVYHSGQRVVASVIAVAGILFWSTIMALTVDVIRDKMDTLRQGRSKMVETKHTLILGWTEKSMHIIEELCNANESEGGGIVAVLAPERKDQMESELALQFPVRQRRGTRVVFRSGSPLVIGDLGKVSANAAKAIIILATSADADRADADTLRTLLSLRSLYVNLRCHVVAEVRDIDNEPLVKLVGGRSVETLVSHDMIGRLMLMAVRQPGLAKVYEAMLGFEGSEFYMSEWPELVGCSFGDLVERLPAAIAIGLCLRDGTIQLCPPPEQPIYEGDKIIVIAEDNDSYKPEKPAQLDVGVEPENTIDEKKVEKILFCGWRRDIRDVLQQLDKIVKPGTEVHMMTHSVPFHLRNTRLMEDGLALEDLRNVELVHHFGNTSVRRKLEMLPIEHYTSCMIFADQEFETDTMHSDSHSLATLLLIRDIQGRRKLAAEGKLAPGNKSSRSYRKKQSEIMLENFPSVRQEHCPIICEVLDPHTQKTIARSEHLSLTSDFCQTNKLVAQVMSMVAEERTVKLILDELLGSGGCHMAVVPSEKYTRRGELLSFWAVARRAARHGEVLIGYQMCCSIEKTVLNPPDKDKQFVWDNTDFAIIQGDVVIHPHYAEKPSDTFNVFSELSHKQELKEQARALRNKKEGVVDRLAGNKEGVVEGLVEDKTITWGDQLWAGNKGDVPGDVKDAMHTFLRILPQANENGIQNACSKLSGTELMSLAESLQVLRTAVAARHGPRPELQKFPAPHAGDVASIGISLSDSS